jgi:hypothetical protein
MRSGLIVVTGWSVIASLWSGEMGQDVVVSVERERVVDSRCQDFKMTAAASEVSPANHSAAHSPPDRFAALSLTLH